jgi:hypothetical protein
MGGGGPGWGGTQGQGDCEARSTSTTCPVLNRLHSVLTYGPLPDATNPSTPSARSARADRVYRGAGLRDAEVQCHRSQQALALPRPALRYNPASSPVARRRDHSATRIRLQGQRAMACAALAGTRILHGGPIRHPIRPSNARLAGSQRSVRNGKSNATVYDNTSSEDEKPFRKEGMRWRRVGARNVSAVRVLDRGPSCSDPGSRSGAGSLRGRCKGVGALQPLCTGVRACLRGVFP